MTTTEATRSKINHIELEKSVKHLYREVALHPEVTYHFEMGRVLAERLGYPSSILDIIPKEAIESFAGVGYYFDLAKIKPGEKVLDMGSGSGMDVFFAEKLTGEKGEVLGIAGVEGNGQTELARLISGLDKPTSGDIELYGQQIQGKTPHQIRDLKIAHVSEDRKGDGTAGDASIRDNVLVDRYHQKPGQK